MPTSWIQILFWLSAAVLTSLTLGASSSNDAVDVKQARAVQPSIRNLYREPFAEFEGSDVLLTCIVHDLGNYTVSWRKESLENGSMVLTAGESRVTSDTRFSIIHDQDEETAKSAWKLKVTSTGDVWVLQIRNVSKSDSGFYACEVNTDPVLQSFHILNVYSGDLQPPEIGDVSSYGKPAASGSGSSSSSRLYKMHNFEQCCRDQKVSDDCLIFCNIAKIMEGNVSNQFDYSACVSYTPAIVQCMADGRNHVPCCVREQVPDICQETCRGEETLLTDNIKTHFSCSNSMEEIIGCISEGIELLPRYPENVRAEPVSETSIKIEWDEPKSSASATAIASSAPNPVTEFALNVTSLKFFDRTVTEPGPGRAGSSIEPIALSRKPPIRSHTVQIRVSGQMNSTIVSNLIPFTMYQISIVALNKHGSSLPSVAVRILTAMPHNKTASGAGNDSAVPSLPDIRQCCIENGINQETCLERLCDPIKAEDVITVDLMQCAPWSSNAFKCLANGIDHTPCCRQRGLPDKCLNLCAGNVTRLDYTYFKCLRYMSEYTNCLMQGYGVLPSAPRQFHVKYIDTEFVILTWTQPQTLAGTVLHYNVYYRDVSGDNDGDNDSDDDDDNDDSDSSYREIFAVHPPFILQNLKSSRRYAVYVTAVNVHGIGESSARLLFLTKSKAVQRKIAKLSTGYNMTECCRRANLTAGCMPLCTYDASVTHIGLLAKTCANDFHKLLRCGVGGRDHKKCCQRRGVPSECENLCSGIVDRSLSEISADCFPFIGNIVLCFEEGTGLLPGPVQELHAINIDRDSVALKWEPPLDAPPSNISHYLIFYAKVENQSSKAVDLRGFQNQKQTNDTRFLLTELENGATYQIYVIAVNGHGSSLPSAIIEVRITNDPGRKTYGTLSAPHSLAVVNPSATYLTITWQPPELSDPHQAISYRLFYKRTSFDNGTLPAAAAPFKTVNTSLTSVLLRNLKPNTQFVVYVKAVADNGNESAASETLIAWTNPAIPATIEVPTIFPTETIVEGKIMSILCTALGLPMPTISLFIAGRLIHQEQTRYLITVVHNVSRDMNQVTCRADNGYGSPSQATKQVDVSYAPEIEASQKIMTASGQTVTITCAVDAFPEPKMVFYRDSSRQLALSDTGKFTVRSGPIADELARYTMSLTIANISAAEADQYICRAENAIGSATKQIQVQLRSTALETNVAKCCGRENVTDVCMNVCSFNLDVAGILSSAFECLPDFNKFLRCAANQSDHRSCCVRAGVPRRCLDWCRGHGLGGGGDSGDDDSYMRSTDSDYCLLSHTKEIFSCFYDGDRNLPGLPLKVRARSFGNGTVRVDWLPPSKNAQLVDFYRIFWRQIGSKTQFRNETTDTYHLIDNLQMNGVYEFSVKAVNSFGSSQLTGPIRMVVNDDGDDDGSNTIDTDSYGDTSRAFASSSSSQGNAFVLTVFTLLFSVVVIAVILAVLVRYRSRGFGTTAGIGNNGFLLSFGSVLGGSRSTPSDYRGHSIENPNYFREEAIAVAAAAASATLAPSTGANSRSTVSPTSLNEPDTFEQQWHSEALHVPDSSSETNPNFYEELRLGQQGVGFKRLKD